MPRIADAVEPVETTGTPISSMAQLLNSNLARQGARGRANMMPPTSIMDERYPAWKRNQEDAEKLMLATDLIGSAIPLAGPAAKGMVKLAQYAKPQVGQALENYAFQTGMALPMVERQAGRTFAAPQDEALRLAQERAALPVERGGLGLPPNNTSEQRAAAMGGKDMVHFSRHGGDYATLDSGQYATAPFDAVGTHVGTPQAAMDRFRNTTATTDQIKGTTYPVTILGNKPLLNQNAMAWGEDDLSAFLRQQGGHNWSDIHDGKMTYQDMNADLRKKLFEKQGYTSIPYYNEVEGKGSISYIVPPENIRSRFAAFDPFRRNAAIAAAMGVAAPDLLAQERTKIKDLAKTK
jgi:hypothetical protein